MKQKMWMILTGVMLFCGILGIVSWMNRNTSSPEKVIKKLEQGINNKNVEQVLDCLGVELRGTIEEVIGLAENVTKLPISTYLKYLPIFNTMGKMENLPKVTIDLLEVETGEDAAQAQVSISLGNGITVEGTLDLVKVEKQWYIIGGRKA